MSYPSIPRLGNKPLSVSQQPLTLREGQMFSGQIKQLFPGQMAEVQIGGQKLMAKLEVPMKADDAYYFQVKSVSPELQIKVVSGPLQATEGQVKQLSTLMDSLQLPKSPEMITVLNHFMKERLPVTKEILLNAVSLLKMVQPSSHNDALNAIQKLVELKLPLNEANLHSLLGVEKKEGLHNALDALRNALITDTGIEAMSKDRVLSRLEDAGRMTASASERALLSSAMLKLLDETSPREERFQFLQLLKNSGMLTSNITLANLQSVLHSRIIESTAGNPRQSDNTILPANQGTPNHTPISSLLEAWKSVLVTDPSGPSNGLNARLGQLIEMVKNTSVLQQPFRSELISLLEVLERTSAAEIRNSSFSERVSKMMFQMTLDENRSLPFSTDITTGQLKDLLPENVNSKLPELFRAIEQSQWPAAKELLQEARTAVELAIDGKVMKDAMQSLFKSLGFNYEAGLLKGKQDIPMTMEMLKPQLVALLQDSAISPALRDATESLIARMNGSILQSGDSGMNQQIVMQLPLEFLGKRIDATIQWSGREKDDGKIDADYARILFYLDLESINKTVVDMQVQNRVVTLTIFNENHQLRDIGNHLQVKLKDGLEAVDYRLSGVIFKNFEEDGKMESKRRNDRMAERSGVDFRI